MLFPVECNKHTIFFIQVAPPDFILFESKRKQADEQMPDHFLDLRFILFRHLSLESVHLVLA
ncbi:hypothetical protein CPB83DRAFT_227140 [Crepidotus variabilis]|uniref:Uncharacterized protein n=1 Tax=Crepidotus variabilis TaxID=179855 RepID=A0A9P6ES24_9AGAR|nr:hypothetical protein CPB83DRAFT_227140 [Crepidotus variabilis]